MASQAPAEFIKQELIDGIDRVLNSGSKWLSYPLITGGIEFLGACHDNHNMNKKRMSEKRFKWALENLFSKQEYSNE